MHPHLTDDEVDILKDADIVAEIEREVTKRLATRIALLDGIADKLTALL